MSAGAARVRLIAWARHPLSQRSCRPRVLGRADRRVSSGL